MLRTRKIIALSAVSALALTASAGAQYYKHFNDYTGNSVAMTPTFGGGGGSWAFWTSAAGWGGPTGTRETQPGFPFNIGGIVGPEDGSWDWAGNGGSRPSEPNRRDNRAGSIVVGGDSGRGYTAFKWNLSGVPGNAVVTTEGDVDFTSFWNHFNETWRAYTGPQSGGPNDAHPFIPGAIALYEIPAGKLAGSNIPSAGAGEFLPQVDPFTGPFTYDDTNGYSRKFWQSTWNQVTSNGTDTGWLATPTNPNPAGVNRVSTWNGSEQAGRATGFNIVSGFNIDSAKLQAWINDPSSYNGVYAAAIFQEEYAQNAAFWTDAFFVNGFAFEGGGGFLRFGFALPEQGFSAAAGNWSDNANWLEGTAPNAALATANIGWTAAKTVTVDADIAVGFINFIANDNAVGGGSVLSLTTGYLGGAAQINVKAGNSTVTAPVLNVDGLDLSALAGSSLTLTNLNVNDQVLRKVGSGMVVINAGQNFSRIEARKGTLKLSGGTVSTANEVYVDNSGFLDLGGSDLVIDYAAPANPGVDPDDFSSPLARILDALRRGVAGGATGGLINSAAPAEVGVTRVGYAEASVFLGITGTGTGTFNGIDVDPSSLLLVATYAGDTNLDGAVDVTDLGNLASNWQAAAGWAGGDSNYDGLVDVSDLGDLASNWQLGVTGPAAPDASLHQALISVGLGSVVPEPASLSLLAVGALALRRRR